MKSTTIDEGLPYPLGATWSADDGSWNFALWSRHAERAKLLVFRREDPARPVFSEELHPLHNRSRHVWHCRVAEDRLAGGDLYAYQLDGPAPDGRFAWHAFDREKVVFDPWAKDVWFPQAFDRSAAVRRGSNMGKAPLGVLVKGDAFDWGDSRPPRHPASDLVVYEMHVRGLTQSPSSGVDESVRGTYLGVIEKIPHLVALGITAVELLPVYQFDPQEGNYWGYMPIGFFSPHDRYYASPEAVDRRDEFRRMVKALHENGIEVILDVVYNHTGEGDHNGPTYSQKGVDNAAYFIGSGDPKHPYGNYSGTGNALDASEPITRRLILDSLRHWVREYHIDGFRFDLASVLSRRSNGAVDPSPAIFTSISSDPELAGVRLIAEPWDAAGLYQLGRGFPGPDWWQWNDRFRDTMRRFVRGDEDMVGRTMECLYGSSDVFPDSVICAYRPYQSINFITCHDGFSLYDLVSYGERHNEANGHGGTDGHSENFSSNHGTEGDAELTAEILELRKQQAKNLATLLLLSSGTPMMLAGDEFLNTQGGNNNPFNQDNETSWLDWARAQEFDEVLEFTRRLIGFRREHPSLRRSTYWREDIHWHGVGEHVDMSFHSRSLALFLDGSRVGDDDLYVMVNMYTEELEFELQHGRPSEWVLVLDTSTSPSFVADECRKLRTRKRRVAARSIVALRRPCRSRAAG